jgi:hypothetical protein
MVKGTDLARQLFGFRRYITTTAAGQTSPAGRQDALYALWSAKTRIEETGEPVDLEAAIDAGLSRTPRRRTRSRLVPPASPMREGGGCDA